MLIHLAATRNLKSPRTSSLTLSHSWQRHIEFTAGVFASVPGRKALAIENGELTLCALHGADTSAATYSNRLVVAKPASSVTQIVMNV